MMYEGKEKRLALIEELLTVANVEPLPEEAVEERLLQAHEERLNDAVLEAIQGEVMSRALDMLSKELIRFKQVHFGHRGIIQNLIGEENLKIGGYCRKR